MGVRSWSTSTVLILVRHGRTAINAAGLLQGRIDEPLDDVGQQQAKAIAAALDPVDRVVSSPLRRAVQTADELGLPVEIDPRWAELDYGSYDGKPVSEIGAAVWERWRSDATFRPPGGESLEEMVARVEPACLELLDAARDADVVVVSHVSPIKAVLAWVLGAGPEVAWRSHLDQGSITRISPSSRGWVLRSFNETMHLGVPLGRSARITG
jgi:broad specificity phosphatase PhoE